MVQPDPALGITGSFPSQQVRNAFLYAMQVGKPEDQTRQVKFIKKASGRRYFLEDQEVFLPPLGSLRVDREGRPLNPEVRVEQAIDQEIYVDCAIELTQAAADELPVGNYRPVKATVTVMRQEYDEIAGCRELIYNNDRYVFAYELTATGLFDITVHTLIFYAINES